MTDYIEKESPILKWLFWLGVVPAMILLFVVLTQPVWNADHLIKQQTENCRKVGGVQIIDHGMFGDTYSCQPRLDRGVKQ